MFEFEKVKSLLIMYKAGARPMINFYISYV